MIDLDELAKLAEAATPGPWHFHQDDGTALDISEVCIPRPEEDVDLSIASLLEDRDGAFIAAANPQAVLALIERVRRVEAERDAAAKVLTEFADAQDSWCEKGRAEQMISRAAMRDALRARAAEIRGAKRDAARQEAGA